MSPLTGNSVMDLLLGKVAPTQQGNPSAPGIGQPVDGEFAGILDMLFGNIGNVAGDASAEGANEPLAALLLTEQPAGDDLITNQALMAEFNAPATQLVGSTPIIVAGLSIPQTIKPEATETGKPDVFANIVGATTKQPSDSMLPKEAVIPNPQVLALLNQIPAELPNGRFAVLSSRVSDGTLRMEVVSPDFPNQKITLSLPTALLNQTNTPQSNPAAAAAGIAGQLAAGKRVPLADPMGSTERFDQLLSKVNVKEIEISASQTVTPSDKVANQVTVSLTGESNGRNLLLTGKLSKNQLTATTQRGVSNSKLEQSDPKSTLEFAGDQTTSSKSDSGKSPVAERASGDNKLFDTLSPSIGKSDAIAPQFSGTEVSSAIARSVRQARSASAVPVDRPAVKLTLGQELPNFAQLEGRTLMIKLEPEFLGPARLHLTMRQETLTARVMVDTPQAKAAVESSLSQLTDQLTKVGIKVDYIDVGVRGGGAQNQFFHNQSNWFRAHNSRVTASNQIEPVSPAVTAATVARQSAGFVAGDRVNIYA